MKEIKLNFRETAIDGLPQESMDCVVRCASGYDPVGLPFSERHKLFNAHDHQKDEEVSCSFDDVTHWMPLSEYHAAFTEDTK